jgi:hypothetical protein
MRPAASPLLVLLALAAAAPARAAGQEILLRAMDLEGVGAWNEAGTLYRQVLAEEPTNAAALLGLERVFVQPAQRDTVLACAERAIAANPAAPTAYAVELRTLRAMGRDSLAARALSRWVAVDSASPAPYREWARLSFRAGRVQDARDAVLLARQRLGDPSALAPELAQVDVQQADWAGAAREWRAAVGAQAVYADAASFSLRPAPTAARDAVIAALTASGPEAATGRQLAADLLLGWSEPGRAWALLKDALPASDSLRIVALRTFAERSQALGGPDAQRAAGAAYDLLAAALPPEDAGRTRIESAQAFAAAGDTAAARRVLRTLAADTAADGETRSAAAAATVELQVREGNPEEASRTLAAALERLSGTERERLARVIARGWLRRGALERAERAVDGDSSLAGDEVRGWVALYRGRLAEARRLLRLAGASVGDRALAPLRAETVALIDAVGQDTLPELGAALLRAARGDSLGASRALVAVARGLADSAAGSEAEPALLAWAARCAAAGRDSAGAEALWLEVADRFGASNAAPAAELALARALAGRGDLKGAARRLEAMILAHPESALVPEARRELDRVRGLVPGT